VLLLAIPLACSSSGPVEKSKPKSTSETPFPPHGPVELRYSAGPAEGTLYQLVIRYEGRTEVASEQDFAADPDTADELVQMELDYRSPRRHAHGRRSRSCSSDALRRHERAPGGAARDRR
jgi:hypothetical protein